MKFSIIIVNYNVKYFLEQCLHSVKKAIAHSSTTVGGLEPGSDGLSSEVFVVDNNSTDGSIEVLKKNFPFVRLIVNTENLGFSKANNQALKMSAGDYILFLNPDTILPEDFLIKCHYHMQSQPRVGAMGVRMLDGRGRFLKESKRAFPGILTSFYKLSGLAGMFPKSKQFARYYLGHLSADTSHQVEALSGACMLVRKTVLEKSGGFDERFFMYAEDIDLSYRIVQLGYANSYFADLSIIHFKGESTRKDIRYVRLFYRAMIQFVQKHYHGKLGSYFTGFLKLAITFRSLFAAGNLHFRASTKKQVPVKRTIFLEGDECSKNEVRLGLQNSNNFQFAGSPNGNVEIFLCEGRNYSFKEVIARMAADPGKSYKIHSSGSSSIIGSEDTRYMGEVIFIPVNN